MNSVVVSNVLLIFHPQCARLEWLLQPRSDADLVRFKPSITKTGRTIGLVWFLLIYPNGNLWGSPNVPVHWEHFHCERLPACPGFEARIRETAIWIVRQHTVKQSRVKSVWWANHRGQSLSAGAAFSGKEMFIPCCPCSPASSTGWSSAVFRVCRCGSQHTVCFVVRRGGSNMTGAGCYVCCTGPLGPGPHSFHARQVIGELGLFLVSMAFLILSFASSLSALEHSSWAFSGLPRAALSLWELSLGMISSKQLHSLGDGGYPGAAKLGNSGEWSWVGIRHRDQFWKRFCWFDQCQYGSHRSAKICWSGIDRHHHSMSSH